MNRIKILTYKEQKCNYWLYKFVKFVMLYLIVVFISFANLAFSQEQDIKGSRDYDIISRYPGTIIKYYDNKEFDEYFLPLEKLKKDNKLSKSKKLEGKVIRITYKAPEGRSTLEIYRNYETALKKSGFEILFSASGASLSEQNEWTEAIYPKEDRYYELRGESRNQRYLCGKFARKQDDIYVSLYISLGWYKYAMIQLDIIETKPIDVGLVSVNADVLADDIKTKGHSSVYDIYFDTDKADIKIESEPMLKEIVKLLEKNPAIKLYVVGHTDNTGLFDYNMELSQRRADAVVKTIVSKYGLDSKRLKAVGVGSLSPVSSNSTEEGKQKNRRVELVEQ